MRNCLKTFETIHLGLNCSSEGHLTGARPSEIECKLVSSRTFEEAYFKRSDANFVAVEMDAAF